MKFAVAILVTAPETLRTRYGRDEPGPRGRTGENTTVGRAADPPTSTATVLNRLTMVTATSTRSWH